MGGDTSAPELLVVFVEVRSDPRLGLYFPACLLGTQTLVPAPAWKCSEPALAVKRAAPLPGHLSDLGEGGIAQEDQREGEGEKVGIGDHCHGCLL